MPAVGVELKMVIHYEEKNNRMASAEVLKKPDRKDLQITQSIFNPANFRPRRIFTNDVSFAIGKNPRTHKR